eukprot:1235703-Rhodomonas_salina.1
MVVEIKGHVLPREAFGHRKGVGVHVVARYQLFHLREHSCVLAHPLNPKPHREPKSACQLWTCAVANTFSARDAREEHSLPSRERECVQDRRSKAERQKEGETEKQQKRV